VGRSLQLPVQDPRIEALGYVDNLADVYSAATCAVVPLLEGGGSPLKLIEALAYGLPVVATHRAAASVEGAVNGTHFLEANDAEAFAEALAEVLTGAYAELGQNGRRLVETGYSIEALVELLRANG
jgi:glycosyltransferase involved in cell wall biosynthesis